MNGRLYKINHIVRTIAIIRIRIIILTSSYYTRDAKSYFHNVQVWEFWIGILIIQLPFHIIVRHTNRAIPNFCFIFAPYVFLWKSQTNNGIIIIIIANVKYILSEEPLNIWTQSLHNWLRSCLHNFVISIDIFWRTKSSCFLCVSTRGFAFGVPFFPFAQEPKNQYH